MSPEPLTQYIYGVIPGAARFAAGADLSAFVESPEGLEAQAADDEIIGRKSIRPVVHEDLAVIVSPARQVDLAKMRKDALAKMLLAHQKVIELIMKNAVTVIPFRLGTFVSCEAEVTDILVKGKRLIRRIFNEARGKIEMDVVATWADFASVLKEIGEGGKIKKLKQELASSARGVNVDDQMKIGLMIKEALDRKRLKISRQISRKLAAASCAQCRHENMDDQMVFNGACLIEAKRRSKFEHRLDELNNLFCEKINFRCVGPLAPYSFYTLELKKIQWEDVDWARRIMDLGDTASVEEIKKAFQHSAHTKHPDHSAQTDETQRAFHDLNSARRIALEYSQACAQTLKTRKIVFSEEKVRQNALLVKIRKAEGRIQNAETKS